MVLQSEIPATEGRSSRHERCSFLCSTLQAIAEANCAVQLEKPLARRSGGLTMYNRYSASVRAEIGRYASRLGVAAAARYFSKRKLDSLICKRSYGFVYRHSVPVLRVPWLSLTYCPTAASQISR